MPKLLLVALIELVIAFVYIWMAWVLITLPIYNVPNWVGPLFLVLLPLGLPITLVLAWRPISRLVNRIK